MEEELGSLDVMAGNVSLEKFDLLADLLSRRAQVVNLIGPSELPRLWSRHILESAAYSLLLDRSLPVTDIGSGAGFPGLVLALLGYRVTLLEPRRKRRLFLSLAAGELNLVGVTVEGSRIEDREAFPSPTQFTARAVAPPGVLLGMMTGAAAAGGTLVCRVAGEMLEPGWAACRRLPCPPLDRPGMLVQYRLNPSSRSSGETDHDPGSEQ